MLAWDVDKLIELASRIEPENIQITAFRELDEPYWYDAEDDTPTCRSIAGHVQLVMDADLAYPVVICPEGRVMDGMHRIEKALLQGLASVRACRLPVLPRPDYIDVDPDDLPYDET